MMHCIWRLFAASGFAICLWGCDSAYESVTVSDIAIEYPYPVPLMGSAGDSSGLRYGGSLGGSFGPSFRGTSASEGNGYVSGTHLRPDREGNLEIGFEDAYGGGYLTYFGESFAVNAYGELSALSGEWFHRYGASAWGRVGRNGFSAMAGAGIAAFDFHIRYRKERYLVHAGEGWSELLGSDTISESRSAWIPHVGLHLGVPISRRARLGIDWSAYYFPDYDFIGAAHFVSPLSLSLTVDLGYRARPTLWVSLLENSIDPSAGRFKAGAGLEF